MANYAQSNGGTCGSRVVLEERDRDDGGFEMSLRAAGPTAVHFLRSRPFAAVIPGDNVAGEVIATGLTQFLNLYNAALIGRLILTWFPNPPQAIVGPLATICDPYLNLFRGIIPPLGGTIDLSPILAFVVLDLFSNSATALSAEVGPDGQFKQPERRRFGLPSIKKAIVANERKAEKKVEEYARQ